MGVAAFASAVIQATEAYFCPIKHQHKQLAAIPSAIPYVEFEEPEGFDYAAKLEALRQLQTGEHANPPSQQVYRPKRLGLKAMDCHGLLAAQ